MRWWEVSVSEEEEEEKAAEEEEEEEENIKLVSHSKIVKFDRILVKSEFGQKYMPK